MAAMAGTKRPFAAMTTTAASSAASSGGGSSGSTPGRDAFALMPVPPSVAEGVREAVLALVFPPGTPRPRRDFKGARPELPGPQPAALTGRSLRQVEAADYWVCEKTDGERAMLLLVAEGTPAPAPPGGYLINRAFEVHTWPRAPEYAAACAAGGPTLADGELLLRTDDGGSGAGNAVYMAFDMLAANGAAVGGAPLSVRLAAIGTQLRAPFRDLDAAAGARGAPRLPLFIGAKHFVRKAALRTVFDCITENPGAAPAGGGSSEGPYRVAPLESAMGAGGAAASHRVYRNGYRINGTDGLLFTPERASYVDLFNPAASATPLLKWKYVDANTVDYALYRSDLSAADTAPTIPGCRGDTLLLLPLWTSAGPSVGLDAFADIRVAEVALSPSTAAAYAALLDRLGRSEVIVECAYDTTLSAWSVERVRDRKTRPNALTTVFHTMEVLAERLAPTDLLTRLTAPPPAAAAGGGAVAGR